MGGACWPILSTYRRLHDVLGRERLVWLGLRWSRPIAAGDEANDIGGELMKQAGQIIDAGQNVGAQPAWQALSDGSASARAVELVESSGGRAQHVRRSGINVPLALTKRIQAQQRCKVVSKNLGSQVLLMRVPTQPSDGFDVQTMLDPFKRFLNAPALVVERGEIIGRPGVGIEQIGGKHAHEALRGCAADQAHRDRGALDFVVRGIGPVRCRQRDDGIASAAAHERSDSIAASVVDAHAKANRAHLQRGDEPGSGIAAIEHEQVALAQQVQMLEQHLALAGVGVVEAGAQHHLKAAGQVQGKDLGALDHAACGVARGQAQVGTIGGHHTQAVPERYVDVSLDQPEQVLSQIGEDDKRQVLTGLGQGLGADAAYQIGLIAQHAEEPIEFGLHGRTRDAEEPADQRGEIEDATPAEVARIGDVAGTQVVRMKVGIELGEDRENPSSYREYRRWKQHASYPLGPMFTRVSGVRGR